MIEMGKDGAARGSMGLVTTKWGDFFNENFRNNIFYGLAVNGQAAWTPFESKIDQIRKAYAWNFFATEDKRILECLDTLSKQNIGLPTYPNGMFNRFWLDPFVRKISKKEYTQAKTFIQQAKQILNFIELIKNQNIIHLNIDNLAYMEFSARMARHYGVKILISDAAFLKQNSLALFVQTELGLPKQDPILEGFKWLKKDLDALLIDYTILWQGLAVEEGLEYPTQRFNILGWHYEQAINALEHQQPVSHHQLQAEWIWQSGIRLGADWGNAKWSYFLKTFEVPKLIKRAIIQGIAANQLIIAVNGESVGQVFSRNSLGQYPLAKAVQWFDITAIVQQGHELLMCGWY